MSERIRNKLRSFLQIEEPSEMNITVHPLFDFDGECFANKMWYRGRSRELSAFYRQLSDENAEKSFWGAKPEPGVSIRKIHTGLPALMTDTLTSVCTQDLYKIEVEGRQEEWDEIARENGIKTLISNATRDVLYLGDGAFKLSYDPEVSESNPIIEFYPADRVEFVRRRDKIIEIIFKTEKRLKNERYILKEHYKKQSITYTLERFSDGSEANIRDFDELDYLVPVKNNAEFLPAVPYIITESAEFKGRGKSIFADKRENFDMLDEIISQWMLAVRKGQIKEYIPDVFLPRDPETGVLLRSSEFADTFISIDSDMSEGANRKIETTQGNIQHDALLSSYCTVLDLCLQGVISPSTLGIDVKKLDNAEAQREKEKTTLYMRDKVLDVLSPVIQELVKAALMFKDNISGAAADIGEVTVTFGGYANPAFEAQVETVGKASQSGVMSTETAVEELYGDTKDDEWKKEEVRRIKEEKGIISADEPAVNDELQFIDV